MSEKSGFPSMTALLGLLAVAGFQNRDKIAEMLRGGSGNADVSRPQGSPQGSGGGILSGLGGLGAGGLLAGGLGELIKKFQQGGFGEVADSWVKSGPNKPASETDLASALGPDVIGRLEQQTGLSRQEILKRLSRELPDAVDKYTPDGRLPQS